MTIFNTSLLREKFVIKPLSLKKEETVVALSNRIELPLYNRHGELVEHFIIRAQNMHQTVRMATRILTEFQRRGALMKRTDTFTWKGLCESITSEFELAFNKGLWVSVYHDGKSVFSMGKSHPLLDLIEKCAFDHAGDYEKAYKVAEDMFSKAGKNVAIEYDGNVALVINIKDREAKFGIILRAADRTTTFNFSVKPRSGDDKAFNLTQALMAAAAFLEGVQLSFLVGMNNVKIVYGHIDRHSPEERHTKEGKRRIDRLRSEITNLEEAYAVNYRPEKPSFDRIIADAEGLAEGIFEPIRDDSF